MSAEKLIEKPTQKGPKNEGPHLLPPSGAKRNEGQYLSAEKFACEFHMVFVPCILIGVSLRSCASVALAQSFS